MFPNKLRRITRHRPSKMAAALVTIALAAGCVADPSDVAPANANQNSADADINADANANTDAGENQAQPDPSVQIVAADAQVSIDPGSELIYEIECEPDGCMADVECRVTPESGAELESADQWFECGSPVSVRAGEHFEEGLHTFEARLSDDDGEETPQDSHETLVLYNFELNLDLDDSGGAIAYSYPFESPVECTRHDDNCLVSCHWEDDDQEVIGDAWDCADGIDIELPEDEEAATLVVEACADENFGDDIDHCAEPQSFEFAYEEPAWESVSAGQSHTCGILTDGSLWCWGDGGDGQLGFDISDVAHPEARVPGQWEKVSAGYHHTCAIDADGGLYCWGANEAGQSDPAEGASDPMDAPTAIGDGSMSWIDVSAGNEHSCAVNEDEELYCWGAEALSGGAEAQMVGDLRELTHPDVMAWQKVAAAVEHTCAIAAHEGEDVMAYCWGDRGSGRLGHGESTGWDDSPQKVESITEVTAISTGKAHSCAITQLGGVQVTCWGANDRLQLGASSHGASNATPVSISDTFQAFAVTSGQNHNCTIRDTGELSCWGADDGGQLGFDTELDPESDPESTPDDVVFDFEETTTIDTITAGGAHTCAIADTGGLYCWGDNESGQLGNNDQDEGFTPTAIYWPFAP